MTGPALEFKVVKVRSVLAPRWWQLRWRFRMWRMRRNAIRARAALTPAERQMLDEIEARVDHEFLFGKASSDAS